MRLILTNAIYFKGTWLMPFDETKTENETFHLPDGTKVQTPMMQFSENRMIDNEFYYSEVAGVKALKLFYSGKKMSMIFLLPKRDSKVNVWLENCLSEEKFENIQKNFEKKKMDKIKIPKFEFKAKYRDEIKTALMNMGMQRAFNSGSADFTGIERSLAENLYISDVIHKAYVKVDEQGTEAAAVTAVVMPTSVGPSSKPSFVADRPFIFAIKDEETGAILFIGSVVNSQSS